MDVYEVIQGEYEETAVIAVFVLREDAQAFADHWNLTHLDAIRSGEPPAGVGGTIPLYGPGQWAPDTPGVIDGATVDGDHRALPSGH